ncbi:hypothetical protein ACFFW8_15595 [Erwinia tracheiphila]
MKHNQERLFSADWPLRYIAGGAIRASLNGTRSCRGTADHASTTARRL